MPGDYNIGNHQIDFFVISFTNSSARSVFGTVNRELALPAVR
jgi:hypothetical protein